MLSTNFHFQLCLEFQNEIIHCTFILPRLRIVRINKIITKHIVIQLSDHPIHPHEQRIIQGSPLPHILANEQNAQKIDKNHLHITALYILLKEKKTCLKIHKSSTVIVLRTSWSSHKEGNSSESMPKSGGSSECVSRDSSP